MSFSWIFKPNAESAATNLAECKVKNHQGKVEKSTAHVLSLDYPLWLSDL